MESLICVVAMTLPGNVINHLFRKHKPGETQDFFFTIRAFMHVQMLQSCLILCDPMDCSPPGSSVLGILQARLLEWVAMPSSRGSS